MSADNGFSSVPETLPAAFLSADPAAEPARKPLSLRPVALAIAIAYLGLLSLIVGTTAVLISQDRRHELRRAENELGSVARALDADLEQSFGQIETVLGVISHSVAGRTGAGTDRAAIESLTRSWLLKTPQVVDFTVSEDASGSRELLFGKPLRTDATHEWAIPLSVPVLSADEHVTGQVRALIRAAYFYPLFREVRLNPEDTISITDARGILLARFPTAESEIGRAYTNAALSGKNVPHETRIATNATGPDHRPAIIATRALAEYPLVIHVSRPLDAALGTYHSNTERVIWGASLFAGLLGVLAWLVFEDVRRREKARQILHRLTEILERRVQQRTLDLETSNKELLAFSYSVSHDLRAPLRAINGFSRALLEDYGVKLDEQGRDYLERIARASVRMGELIDALLKLAQVARQPLELVELDISAIASEMLEDLHRTNGDRRLEASVQPDMHVHADEALLRNVLGNLIDNAWKFTRERDPAEIEVASRDSGDHILFWVRDNGVGFDMSYAGRLFQPFQQLHTGQGYAGTGIGLASARRIIERHGGRMWVESTPEQGTAVLFTLPRAVTVIRHPH